MRILALLLTLLSLSNSRAGSTVALTHMKAGGSTNATAAAGAFKGNDATGTGNPLLGLLNDGGTANYHDDDSTRTFSSTGMFSTSADTDVGTALGDLDWEYKGKSDDSGSGPFASNPGGKTGTLTLDNAVSGNVVISMKANGGYAVFAFSGLSNVTTFSFDTSSIGNGDHSLSHATLYQSAASSSAIPEPSTLVVWTLLTGVAGCVAWRRRRKVAKNTP